MSVEWVLNNRPLWLASPFLTVVCIAGSHDNNLPFSDADPGYIPNADSTRQILTWIFLMYVWTYVQTCARTHAGTYIRMYVRTCLKNVVDTLNTYMRQRLIIWTCTWFAIQRSSASESDHFQGSLTVNFIETALSIWFASTFCACRWLFSVAAAGIAFIGFLSAGPSRPSEHQHLYYTGWRGAICMLQLRTI